MEGGYWLDRRHGSRRWGWRYRRHLRWAVVPASMADIGAPHLAGLVQWQALPRRHDGSQRRDLGVYFRLVSRQRFSRCIRRGRLGKTRQHINALQQHLGARW